MSIIGIGEVADLAKTAINKIWPDKTEQEKAELSAALMVVQGQLQVNAAEAASSSVFVAGWRPFIGWVCGMACAWNWIGLPLAKIGLSMSGTVLAVAPADMSEMLPVLMGMLGLGALRTVEKIKQVAR